MNSERLTLLAAGTLCALVSLAGILVASSPGIVIGPIIDRFVSPRLFAAMGRSYASPGAPLWAASFAGLALIAATTVSPKYPSAGLQLTLFVAVPGVVLAVIAFFRPLARLGAVALGVCVMAIVASYLQWSHH